jgi:hypothetical protein
MDKATPLILGSILTVLVTAAAYFWWQYDPVPEICRDMNSPTREYCADLLRAEQDTP